MIKSNPHDIPVIIDGYSFNADIEVLAGNPVQNYNKDTDQYEPDRSLVPCVLMPVVSVSDPEGVMAGEQTVTGAEWYEGAPKADGSNRISDGTAGYTISASGKPTYSLTVTKNIDYDHPIELFAIFSFTDKRRNTQVKVERSIALRTTIFDSTNYSLKLNRGKGWSLNPLEQPDYTKPWTQSIVAQLYSGHEAVADANAAYWWQVKNVFEGDSDFRDFTADELEAHVSGHQSKTLTFDARLLKNAVFRCRAAYYTGSKPSAPTSDELQATTAYKVEMPATMRVDIVQTRGIKVAATLKTVADFECRLSYNNTALAEGKYGLFRISWYLRSGKSGSTAQYLGLGRTVSFTPANFGLDVNYPVYCYAEVSLYDRFYCVTDSSGKYLTDTAGKLIINPKFV